MEDLENNNSAEIFSVNKYNLPKGFWPDYALVRDKDITDEKQILKYETFEANLTQCVMEVENGLKLERVTEIIDDTEKIFTLISIEDDLLKAYAEALRIRLPIERKG
jgi:hypothetical protein